MNAGTTNTPFGVVDRRGERTDLGRFLDDAEPVAQPLDRGARHEDRAFVRVRRRPAVGELPRDGGEQALDRGGQSSPTFISTNDPVP